MPLQNAQYDAIMREYDRRRQLHRHELEERKEKLYKEFPRLLDIQTTIASLSVRAVRLRLSGSEEEAFMCKESIRQLVDERNALLEQHGYPEDYLSLQYDCPDCEDTGYIDGEKCRCFKKAAVDLLYTQSNMREILQKENFSHFSFDYYSDTIRDEVTGYSARESAHDAVMKARHFIDSFGKEFQNLFLHGNTGVGKTFLTNCIAKELIDRANCVIYFSAFDLFQTLAQNTFQKDTSIENIQEDILNCDLLIIDDLGTELTNTFVTTALFQCINERILRKKSTIISTNLSLDQFKDLYSERIFSRITSNYTMIKLIGKDIRLQKRLLGGK
jgi:DNA replication protein DnaC